MRRSSGRKTPDASLWCPVETKRTAFRGLPTNLANLCPLSRRVEFSGFGEDLGQPVRKSIEAASRRAIWQRPSEHLHCMLSEEQRVNDTVKAATGRDCWRFRLWGQMSRLRAGQMELALRVGVSDLLNSAPICSYPSLRPQSIFHTKAPLPSTPLHSVFSS
jgi:hypothetical protein